MKTFLEYNGQNPFRRAEKIKPRKNKNATFCQFSSSWPGESDPYVKARLISAF